MLRTSILSLCALVALAAWQPYYGLAQVKDQVFKGVLSNANPRITYKVKMMAGKRYIVTMQSKAFDTYLELWDGAAKKWLEKDDDGGEGRNSRLVFTPRKDDTYNIVARSFGNTGRGPFIVTVSVEKPHFFAGGKLTNNDPLDAVRKNSHHKVHVVKMKAGKRYELDLASKDFDTYLRIENSQKVNLVEDDDGGPGLNSAIIFRPKADDDYRIIVTSFSTATGSYTVTVRE